MNEVKITMDANDWMTVGAAKDRLGLTTEEFARRAIRLLAESVIGDAASAAAEA